MKILPKRVLIDHNYTLKEQLAQGGMAEIYRGIDTRTQREVAIKVLTPELSKHHYFRQQFEQEARTLASVSHPNIVKLLDVLFINEHTPCLVMELLPGHTLFHELHQRFSMKPETTLEVAYEIALALEAIHTKDLVHNDIKPENIIVQRTPSKLQVTLIDFGITYDNGAWLRQNPALATKNYGTPQYMAPERIEDSNTQDPRSDLYALGCCMYEMLLGISPFASVDTHDTLSKHLNQPPEPLPTWVPVPMAELVMGLLEKDRTKRPQSASALLAQLRQVKEAMQTTKHAQLKHYGVAWGISEASLVTELPDFEEVANTTGVPKHSEWSVTKPNEQEIQAILNAHERSTQEVVLD